MVESDDDLQKKPECSSSAIVRNNAVYFARTLKERFPVRRVVSKLSDIPVHMFASVRFLKRKILLNTIYMFEPTKSRALQICDKFTQINERLFSFVLRIRQSNSNNLAIMFD